MRRVKWSIRVGIVALVALAVVIGRWAGKGSTVIFVTDGDERHDFTPSVSPDGRLLIYSHFQVLQEIDLASGVERPISKHLLYSHFEPAYSPDGSRVAFSMHHGQSLDIVVMDLNNGSISCLTHDLWEDISPCWSPDGRAIVYTKVLIRRDGKYVFLDKPIFPSSQPSKQANLIPSGLNPFAMMGRMGRGRMERIEKISHVFKVSLKDKRSVRLTPLSAWGRSPSWSPDGKKIAFVSGKGGRDIWLMNPDGSGAAPITNNPRYEDEPCWSPDGKFIVFTVWEEESRDLWAIPARGGEPFQLTKVSPPFRAFSPTFSPDGKNIFFSLNKQTTVVLRRIPFDPNRKEPVPVTQ